MISRCREPDTRDRSEGDATPETKEYGSEAGSDPSRSRRPPRGKGVHDAGNQLIYGDNLDVLPRYVPDESVDLIYLDPPFNSNADYNVLFAEQDGSRAAAQIKAFGDTWRWDAVAARTYNEFIATGPNRASQAMQAFRKLLGENDMLAYLAMMAPRLVELRRVLKPTGSIYLHCDPTASHYLKLLMDAVFGPENFRNEIIWKRHNARSSEQRWPRVHDVLLFYSEGRRTSIPKSSPVTRPSFRTPSSPGQTARNTRLTN